MDIRQLEHFVALIEHKTLHAASRALGRSQPALSRSIQKLERTMNVSLLAHEGRRVVPTAAGQTFYQRAKLILNECRSAGQEARALEAGNVGEVRIGIGTMFADYIVDDAIAELSLEAPEITVKATEGFYEDLVGQLLSGQLDLLFLNFIPAAHNANLQFEALATLSGAAFARPDHRLARAKGLTPRDAVGEAWIVIDQPHATAHFAKIFEEASLALPARIFATNSLNLIKSLMCKADFVTYIPEEMVLQELSDGRLVRLDFPAFTYKRKAGLIARAGQYRSPAMERLMAAIRRAAKRSAATAKRRGA
ncbi:MAG: LysR family transcriptional regulator [Rhodospirillaceae bacterium]|nr:LysR family transcriptional regulator [Rhodospirillaceae bacterium]